MSSNEFLDFTANLSKYFTEVPTSQVKKEIKQSSVIRIPKSDVITYQQEQVFFVPAKAYTKYFTQLDYLTIKYILEENPPLTIEEIRANFEEKSKELYNKLCSSPTLPDFKDKLAICGPKSENSIYRYIKELMKEDVNVVVEAGR